MNTEKKTLSVKIATHAITVTSTKRLSQSLWSAASTTMTYLKHRHEDPMRMVVYNAKTSTATIIDMITLESTTVALVVGSGSDGMPNPLLAQYAEHNWPYVVVYREMDPMGYARRIGRDAARSVLKRLRAAMGDNAPEVSCCL